MRIGLDYRPALLGRSGIPRAVRELARALAARSSVDLRLFGHSWARATEAPAPPPGSRLSRTRLPGRALAPLALLGVGAERLCGGVDLFHWTDFVQPPVGRRTPVVLTLHDCAFAIHPDYHGASSASLTARTRRAIARADAVVCPTRATAADAVAHLGAPGSRLRVVPFGVDHGAEPAAQHPRGDRPYVVMIGTIEPRKNHLRALRAWRALGPGRPDLVVVGRPGWRCAEAIDALNREERLTWLRDADDATVATLVAHARAMLYPSRLEGFGFPPLEALARGVPVVCGDTPALREIAGDAATFCDPDDDEAIRAALQTALDDDGPAASAMRRARAAEFRWDRCAAEYEAVYRELLTA